MEHEKFPSVATHLHNILHNLFEVLQQKYYLLLIVCQEKFSKLCLYFNDIKITGFFSSTCLRGTALKHFLS